MVKKYLMLAKSSIHFDIAYPAWYWSHLIVTFSKLVLMVSFWSAVFDGKQLINGWDLSSLITYTVLSMLLNEYVNGASWELSNLIRTGQISVELLRPYDLHFRLMAQDVGATISNMMRTAVPLVLFMAFVYHLQFPVTILAGILFLWTVIVAIVLGNLIDLIIGTMAFWLENMWGLRVFKAALFLFFNGALIPLNMFPDWLQHLCMWTPFPSLVYTPVGIFTGRIVGEPMWIACFIQLLWVVVIFIVLRMVWRVALRKVTVFGG
jgi:ABC-2 type transport system permease protein